MAGTTTATGNQEAGGTAGDTKRRSLTNAGAATLQRIHGRRDAGQQCVHGRRAALQPRLRCDAVSCSDAVLARRRRSCNGAFVAGGGAAIKRSAPTAELQWSCKSLAAELQWSASRRRQSCNGAACKSPPAELQWSAPRRRRSCNGVIDTDGGAVMELPASRRLQSCNGALLAGGGVAME
ncbi:hypothetical protein VPH35_062302 [Triticum aestivum]